MYPLMGSLYRSQHELLQLFKKGDAPHVDIVELAKKGRWRSDIWMGALESCLKVSVQRLPCSARDVGRR